MKIVTSKQMAAIEQNAYAEGLEEETFMEQAGEEIAYVAADYIELHELPSDILLLCGKGNNGGDNYVAGRHLMAMDYEVTALQSVPIEQTSSLCRKNYERFIEEGGKVWDGSTPVEKLFFASTGLIIDGLFGTGFHGTVEEPFASIIDLANRSQRPIISIDIPSGLNGESGSVEGEVIIATETTFLGLPKKGFFLRDGWDCVGKLRYVDFGLPAHCIEGAESNMALLTYDLLRPLLPKLRRSRHKYQAGYVIALAGSYGMAGAALLATRAALHSGAGIVRLFHPEGMEGLLAGACPELIRTSFSHDRLQPLLHELERASSLLLGPGLGATPETKKLLHELLPQVEVATVIDADALTLFAEEPFPLPRHTVLTPHRGELKRLLQLDRIDELNDELLLRCQQYAEEKGITLLLKGGPTFLFHPGRPISVCPLGDPGMATAGSGDVLTGMIAALLAQGMPLPQAAMMGAFLHGLAGEHAAITYTSYCMTASDLIDFLPEAFLFLET